MNAVANVVALAGPFQQAKSAHCHNDLGVAYHSAGDLAKAVDCFRQALRANPQFATAHCNLGNVLLLQDKRDEAMQCYRETLRWEPRHAKAHYNLGCLLQEQDNADEALTHFRHAVQARPDFVQARQNLGGMLVERGEFEEALAHCSYAVSHNRHDPAAHNNLASAFYGLARFEEAETHYGQALKLDPCHAGANWNVSQLWLLHGDFEKGWPGDQWRRKMSHIGPRQFPQPFWDGSIQSDRTILIHAEQGLGDMMQFIRYAPLVKRRVGRVIFDCHAALFPLLSGFPGIDLLLPAGWPLPHFDIQAPLFSLPSVFRTRLDTIPPPAPLRPKAALVKQWRRLLEPIKGFKIGIAWQGNAKGDWHRSIPLAQFAKLAQVKGVQLISLQKGLGTEQLPSVADRFPVIDYGSDFDDPAGAFMDTAAIMANLDLVVSSDNSLVHLAGSLGVPVWVGLPQVPEWRWLLNRQDSPWYPSMRLFRQTLRGQWDDVFARIAEKVEALAASQTPGLSE